MIRLVDTLKHLQNSKRSPLIPSFSFVEMRGRIIFSFSRSFKNKVPHISSRALTKQKKKSKVTEGEVIPEELYKQLEDILPDSRWVKWMKLYLLMNRYYSDFWKMFAFFVVGLLTLSCYSIYFLARNPKKMFDLKSILEDEIQNAAIGNVMDEIRSNLYFQFKKWEEQHDVIKKLILSILTQFKMDPNEAYLHFRGNMNLKFIETHEHDCLSQLFLYQLFNMCNFQELLANQQIFYLHIKEAPEHNKQKNIIKELKIVVKGIRQIVEERQRKNIRRSSKKRRVFIIDNIQELQIYWDNLEKKKQLLEVFYQLKQLQQTEEVNIYAISYDSLFVNDLVTELKEKEDNFTRIQKNFSEDCTLNTIIKNVKENHEEYSDLSLIFGQFLSNVNKMKNIRNIFQVCRVCNSLKWTLGHPADILNEINPEIKTIMQRKQINIRQQIKRAVFKGDQSLCHKKIRLLIKLLLYYSDLKVWKDLDLAIESLSKDQTEAYIDLCRSKILFYLTFYKKEYQAEFFNIIKDNHYYHSFFKEQFQNMKEKNHVSSAKAESYFSQIIEEEKLYNQTSKYKGSNPK